MSEVHSDDPSHPERIAENQVRYAGILRDHRPDSSQQLRTAFMESMLGKEYGANETLDAFDWFWEGWAKSSGARQHTSERTAQTAPTCTRCNGSGTAEAMTNHLGPDDYTVDVTCPECGGIGTLTPRTNDKRTHAYSLDNLVAVLLLDHKIDAAQARFLTSVARMLETSATHPALTPGELKFLASGWVMEIPGTHTFERDLIAAVQEYASKPAPEDNTPAADILRRCFGIPAEADSRGTQK